MEAFHINGIQHILSQFVDATRPEQLINKADIPVITREVGAFACCSKAMYALINSDEITTFVLNILSSRFGKPLCHLAVKWDTYGCRKWLWRYIETSGDRHHFYLLQDIRKEISDSETSLNARTGYTDSYRKPVVLKKIWRMLIAEATCRNPLLERTPSPKSPKLSPQFNNILDIIFQGASLIAEALKEAPLKEPTRSSSISGSVYPLKPNHIGEFLSYLQEGLDQLYRQSQKKAPFSIDYEHFNHRTALRSPSKLPSISFTTLYHSYKKVINAIGSGWVATHLKDHHLIQYTESEMTHSLFIKNHDHHLLINTEPFFFRIAAEVLGISKFLSIGHKWNSEDPTFLRRTDADFRKPYYLWIRKDKLEEVVDKLQLTLT